MEHELDKDMTTEDLQGHLGSTAFFKERFE